MAGNDPFEAAKNALEHLRLKGLQRALENAESREDYGEATRLKALLDAALPAAALSDAMPLSLGVLEGRIRDVERKGGLARAAGCYCGAEPDYDDCCGFLHSDPAARTSAGPLKTLLARYSAFCEGTVLSVDYIIDTTHRNNSEFTADRERWRQSLFDFCRSTGFTEVKVLHTRRFRLTSEGLDLLDDEAATASEAQENDRAYITWTARLRLLDGIVSDEYVETKDFVERSIMVHEEGQWWYLGGDPDFRPKNIRVAGPLDFSGGGKLGSRVTGFLGGLAGAARR